VENGGGLVATEFTSLYTEWRERKSDFGLKDLFKVNPPDWNGRSSQESVLTIPVQKNIMGKGRVVYISEFQPAIQKPLTVPMASQYWKLPVNWNELLGSVKWASGNNLSLNIQAPLSVTMELVQKNDSSAMILHLLNFDYMNSPVKDIKVDLKVPEANRVTQVTVLTPDGSNDEIIKFKEDEKRVIFTVPRLTIYNMIVIKLE